MFASSSPRGERTHGHAVNLFIEFAIKRVVGVRLQPVFTSRKIGDCLKLRDEKPKIVSEQCVVYYFKCCLCDMDYVGYTNRHLHQRVAEHSSQNSSIGKHMLNTHGISKQS